ncbi:MULTISPECIES: site-specific integrase [Flavobacterium]|uniref:Tyr recombinase domain-containing protein n=2 Tax=Flavobacterium TaxID=237 RepID=A0A246GLU7_9FLAO|nr:MULTISPECIES: site-specific integrase [Flavobacterium]OWP78541.1 hypothetical protein BWG23_01900 [Flavobacterium oreochromis]OWP85304.1 hypothetical protein BWK59_00795 [Flavobacterium davisii]
MIKATIKMVLDGRPLSDGSYQVYLRILKNRKPKKISIGLKCNKEHFINESFTKQHPDYRIENELLLKMRSRAMEIIRNFQVNQTDFTLEEFENEFRGIKKEQDAKVFEFFNEIIDEMNRAGRIGNAQAYKDTRDSIFKFSDKKILFKDITPTFLEKYEVYLREHGNKNGGIAFKMREFRSIFNKAIKRKLIPSELYPFKDYKISKLKTESRKIALSLEEFKKIKNVDLSGYPMLIEAYNFFMFSVYTRGMNFKDMMTLKWSDIQNNRIYYVRSKTKGKLNFEIIEPVQKILDFYKAQNRDTKFVFPILLSEDMSPNQIANRHHKVLRRYNSKLKKIGLIAGIDKLPTSYVARHSFATILKMSGTPIEKISEMMGHSDVSITISYLKEFSNEDLDEENRKFMDI